jgi:hypothetical protein
MARTAYEWRRVLRWPNGTECRGMGTGELQAREDCTLAQRLAFPAAQGVRVTLERRRVGAWAVVEEIPLPSAGDEASPCYTPDG